MLVFALTLVALVGALLYAARLRQVAKTAPTLTKMIAAADCPDVPTIAVIIPAYNEAANIRACIRSVLQSSPLNSDRLTVWIVDDQSQDETLAIARSLQQALDDPRLQVLAGLPRPAHETWMGKNWACTQAAQQAAAEFLLFLDADVRLKPGAIAQSLQFMQQQQIDLLTLCPEILCGCGAEWLVQPLMVSLLMAGFDFNAVNDPDSTTAFAAGPFMLFRRSAYEQLGGHRAVADQVVEDVELARRAKQQRLKFRYFPAPQLASIQMYQSWAALWEGWTKNWHLGSRRNWSVTLFSAAIMAIACVLPWIGLILWLVVLLAGGWNWLHGVALALVGAAIWLQFDLRRSVQCVTATPTRYWWFSGIGGSLVMAIALGSILKTETGWGWTWRGRSLKLPNEIA